MIALFSDSRLTRPLVVVLLCVSVVFGCAPGVVTKIDPNSLPSEIVARISVNAREIPAQLDPGSAFGLATYDQIREVHNRRVSLLSSIYVRASFNAAFVDDQGTTQVENGEGWLVIVPPSRLAIVWGKVGETVLWIGCDESRFWCFDNTKRPRKALVCRNENAYAKGTEVAPWFVQPLDFMSITGVLPLPHSSPPPQVTIATLTVNRRAVNTYCFDVKQAKYTYRFFFERASNLPLRVEIRDSEALEPIATATLGRYQEFVVHRGGNTVAVLAPQQIHVAGRIQRGELLLESISISETQASGKQIKSEMFSFDAIKLSMNPQEVVILDKSSPNPASAGVQPGDNP